MALRSGLMNKVQAADPHNVCIVAAQHRHKDFLKLGVAERSPWSDATPSRRNTALFDGLSCVTDRKKDGIYLLCFFNPDNTDCERVYVVRQLRSRTQFILRPEDEYLKNRVRMTKMSGLYEAVSKPNRRSTKGKAGCESSTSWLICDLRELKRRCSTVSNGVRSEAVRYNHRRKRWGVIPGRNRCTAFDAVGQLDLALRRNQRDVRSGF